MITNKNFTAALAHVRAHYAELFHPRLEGINLVRNNRAVYGEFWARIVRSDPATGKPVYVDRSVITISNKRRTVAEFVSTIVHELTHLAQYVDGRKFDESEAMRAGYAASRAYHGAY